MGPSRAALTALLAASLARAADVSDLALALPSGWRKSPSAPGAVLSLEGPEGRSFVVKRAPSAPPADNPAAVAGYLRGALAGLRDASRRDYRSDGRVETRVLRDGLSVHVLSAGLQGRERLAVGLFESAGTTHLAVAAGEAPRETFDALLGAAAPGPAGGLVSGTGRSLDGQLEIALGGGLRSRSLLADERAKGFVLAVSGSEGAEVLFQKLSDAEATRPEEQGPMARALAAAAAEVPQARAAPVRAAASGAGPAGVYSWAERPGSRERVAAGYLPWGYWGYQVFARGPGADELLVGILAALRAGPSAQPALVAASPRIPLSDGPEPPPRLWLAAAAAALAGVLAAWSFRLKKR